MRENMSLLADILTLLGAFFLGYIAGSIFPPLRRLLASLLRAPGEFTRGAKNVGERLRQAFKPSEDPLDRSGISGALAGAVSDVLTLRARHAEASFRKGMTAFDQGEYDLARREFSRAILWDSKRELEPMHVLAHLRLGWLDEERGALREAREHYQEAMRLDAENLTATVRLGMMCFRLGETGPAIFQFQRALELDPSDLDTHYYLYAIYRQAAMEREALEQLRILKAGEDAQTLARLFAHHGEDNLRLAHYTEASNDYELALQIDPAQGSLYMALGDLQYLQQQPRTALETWCRGLYTGYLDALAERVLSAAREVEDAWPVIQLVRDCAGQHPRDGKYDLLLSRLLRQVGEEASGTRHLERAVELCPQLLDAQQELGDLYARLGREAEASATYHNGLKAALAQETTYRCRVCGYLTQEEQPRCFRCNRWGTFEHVSRAEAHARNAPVHNLLERASAVRASLSTFWSRVAGQLPSGD